MTCCRKLEAHSVREQFNMRAGMLAFHKTTMIFCKTKNGVTKEWKKRKIDQQVGDVCSHGAMQSRHF